MAVTRKTMYVTSVVMRCTMSAWDENSSRREKGFTFTSVSHEVLLSMQTAILTA